MVGVGVSASLYLALPAAAVPNEAEKPETADLAELSLEDLVSAKIQTVHAASRREQAVSQAPSLVSVVTREDFQQYGYRTLADALRGVRGFYVTGDRGYNYVGLRGVNRPGDYGGGVLMMIDGHRLNDPVADQAFSGGEFPLDVDLIERVEVVRGPGSVLYGNNALFTVIDVVTRKGREVGTEGSASAASLDTYAGRFSTSKSFTNGVEVLVSGSYLHSRGHPRLHYPEFAKVNQGWAEGLDGEDRGSTFLKVSYGDVSLNAGYALREKSLPTAAYGSIFNAGPNHLLDERAWADLSYQSPSASEWDVQVGLYLDHYHYEGLAPFDGADLGVPGRRVMNVDVSRTDWWGGGFQASREWIQDHRVTMGLEGRHNARVDQDNYYVEPARLENRVHGAAYNVGVYLQEEWTIRTNLVMEAGGRYDHFSSFGDALNPRAAVIWSPLKSSTFKLLYGQAYRAPNAFEYDYSGAGYVANRGLKPEAFRSAELIWEQKLTRELSLTTALFQNQISKQITQVDETLDPAVGGWIFRNLGDAEIRGAEVGVEGTWKGGLRARVGYTYSEARSTDTGARLSNSPEHLVQANVVVPLYREKLFAGFEVQAMSRRRSAVSDDFAGAYGVANLTLFSRDLVRGLEVSGSIYNIFDASYGDPVSPDFTQQFIVQDGRQFRLKVTYRF